MRCRLTRGLSRLFALILALALPASAQVIAPVAGEHADFTRVVLRLPVGTPWTLSPEGRERRFLVMAENARFTLDALFTRIPRRRLSAAQSEGGTLILQLACDCPIRAWEDRPGLVILDISDAPAGAARETATPPSPTVDPLPLAQPQRDALATARAAGEALARSRPRPEEGATGLPEDPRLAGLAQDLGRTMASALGQGLLDPAVGTLLPDAGLLAETPLPELPANMRVATVLTRDDPSAPPRAERPPRCAGAEVLDRILQQNVSEFGAELGRLSRALYGEFDQPDAQSRLDLIGLYLAAGFGAEARALLENGPDPVAGRDFALGMADVLEGRASNSRMRLAQGIDCGGAVALMAVLAGAEAASVARNAGQIALDFSALPASLRGLTGVELASVMADAGALDAARIVADALARSDWVSRPELALVEARLDRARALPAEAAARLALDGNDTPEIVQTRLDLALETQASLDPGYLFSAEALAATSRDLETGPELMAAIIRLHNRSGAHPDAFSALDRLESWMQGTGENQRLLGSLRDEVWATLALRETDFGLVEAVLARSDWQDPALTTATRLALANRLLDLGLATPAAELIEALPGPEARVLQARRLLAAGEGSAGLELLSGLETEPARQTRAAILQQLGDFAGAAAEFGALGLTDAQARAAILAGDWRRLEELTLQGRNGQPRATLEPMLGRAPGHAETALRQAAEHAQSMAESSSDAAPITSGPGGTAEETLAPAPGAATALLAPGASAQTAATNTQGPVGAVADRAAQGGDVAPGDGSLLADATAQGDAAAARAGAAAAGAAPTAPLAAQVAAPVGPPELSVAAPPLSAPPAADAPVANAPVTAVPTLAALPPAPPAAAEPAPNAGAQPGTGPGAGGFPADSGLAQAPGASGALAETRAAAQAGFPPLPDPGAVFDRLGMVSRSSTLLSESERLRDALAPLLQTEGPAGN